MKELETIIRQIAEDKQKLEKLMEGCRNELTKLRERRYHIDTIGKKLSVKINLQKSLEAQNIDLLSEARRIFEKIAEISKLKSKIFKDYVQTAKNLLILNKDKVFSVYQDAQFQNEKLKLDNDWRSYSTQKQDLESQVEKSQAAVRQAKEDARFSLETASKMNEINLEKGLPDNYKQKFAKLADSLDKLEAEIHQCEAIAQCSYDVDEKVVEDFEKRKKLIEQLQKDFEKKIKSYWIIKVIMKS